MTAPISWLGLPTTAGIQSAANLLLNTPTWHRDASCAGLEPADADRLFFPQNGTLTLEAQSLCGGCPVRSDCASFGETEEFGVYGGMTPTQRAGKTDAA